MKILLNIATHGDENIGFEVAKEIKKLNIDQNIFIVQIANKKAFGLHKRFIDQDLNRSFPGKKRGNYEERRAYELLPIIKSVDLVIDIHSTTSDLKDTLIVTKLDSKTLKYVKIIQPKHVLVMNATKDNALISAAKIGIAFEYGGDNNKEVLQKTILGIKRLLNYLGIINEKLPVTSIKTIYYDVISTVTRLRGYKLNSNIKNYKLVRKGVLIAEKGKDLLVAEEDFYPILFFEKSYKDYFGFKAKKIKI